MARDRMPEEEWIYGEVMKRVSEFFENWDSPFWESRLPQAPDRGRGLEFQGEGNGLGKTDLQKSVERVEEALDVDFGEVFDRGRYIMSEDPRKLAAARHSKKIAPSTNGRTEVFEEKELLAYPSFDDLTRWNQDHAMYHEYGHGLWYEESVEEFMREQSFSIPSVMHLSEQLERSEEEMEGANEYFARVINPEREKVMYSPWEKVMDSKGWIHPYEENVRETVDKMQKRGIDLDEETLEPVDGSLYAGQNILHTEAGIDYYLEHGEVEDGGEKQDYILTFGDSEEIAGYLNRFYDGKIELFQYDSPLDEETGSYEMPDTEEFERFLDRYSEDDYNPSYEDLENSTAPEPTAARGEGTPPEPGESGASYGPAGA